MENLTGERVYDLRHRLLTCTVANRTASLFLILGIPEYANTVQGVRHLMPKVARLQSPATPNGKAVEKK